MSASITEPSDWLTRVYDLRFQHQRNKYFNLNTKEFEPQWVKARVLGVKIYNDVNQMLGECGFSNIFPRAKHWADARSRSLSIYSERQMKSHGVRVFKIRVIDSWNKKKREFS